MKTLMFVAVGTRGDIQPIIALAEAVKAVGYRVVILGGANFKEWVESRNLTFYPMQVNMEDMMNTPEGKAWVDNAGKNPISEGRAMRRMLNAHGAAIIEDVIRFCPEADVLFSNLPSFGLVDAIAEKCNKPHIRIMFSPLTPTNDPRSTMVPAYARGSSPLNRFAAYIGIYFTYWVAKENVASMREQLGLPAWGWSDYRRAWGNVPVLTGISPLITPPDPLWDDRVAVTGYWFGQEDSTWQPPQALQDFLAQGEAPIYVGFGSMPNSDPERTTRSIIAALERTGQRGIIQRGWAQLGMLPQPDHIFSLDSAPHEWLFPRMRALIHHGGAGTTAMGIRAGVPATIVSHLGDQPYWGRRLHELGIGGKPISSLHLNASKLEDAIQTMLTEDVQQRARTFSEQFRQEKGVANAVAFIQRVERVCKMNGIV